MARKMKQMRECDIKLIFTLQHELDRMRTKLLLSHILAKYPYKNKSHNPVINFTFTLAQTAVIEWLILRFSEAINLLNRASQQFLGRRLYIRGKKRNTYESSIKGIPYLLELRHEKIAHRISNLEYNSGVFDEVKKNYGDIYNFLIEFIDVLHDIIQQLEKNGIYEGIQNLQSVYSEIDEFTNEDVQKIIEVANSLISTKSSKDVRLLAW